MEGYVDVVIVVLLLGLVVDGEVRSWSGCCYSVAVLVGYGLGCVYGDGGGVVVFGWGGLSVSVVGRRELGLGDENGLW